MKSYCRFAGAVFLLALLGAEARPIPWVKLPDLASESDVVVLGGIVSAVQVGVTSIQLEGEEAPSRARVMVGDLHVQEIWKGTPDTSDITVRYDLPALQARTVRPSMACPAPCPRAVRCRSGWLYA